MSDHNPDPAAPPTPAQLTRRGFLLRTGQAGAALLVMPGALRAALRPGIPQRRAAGLAAGPLPESVFSGLRWRTLGPFRGGRVDAVSGVPGRPHEFYFGHVNGGVWKTLDGGRIWEPVFDAQPVASVGALAVAPSAPDTVYVGTGECTPRDSMGYGNGVYRSTDAGRTWSHLGLDATQHIGRIAVHPTNPDIVFVAALGSLYAANPERGVFRTTDGGRSWQKVLFTGPDVGAVEVVVDPSDPRVVYAGLWNTRRPPWYTYAPTNGPGGGLYKSTDGGDTWHRLTTGLPADGIGRSGIAIAPSRPQRVYAVVDCLVPEPGAPPPPAPAPGAQFQRDTTPRQGGFFRSDDGGATWTRLSSDTALWGRGWYFEHVAVDPRDPDTVYVSNVAVSRSRDGGRTWVAYRGSPGGDDYHQPWVSPEDPDTMIVASDQGAIITRNARAEDPRDVSWSSWLNQPTAQVYHCSVDYRVPYWVTGAQQDSGAVAVRSRGKFGEISMRDWEPIAAGGESGYTAGDPLHPGIIFGGAGTRLDLAENRVIPGSTPPDAEPTARRAWTQPLVLSKADPHALYYADQYLFKSTDSARTWRKISPDLTRPEPGIPSNLDAAAASDTGNGRRGVIYTIAPSPLQAPVLWIGTDDGLIQLTMDDGATWSDVTPPALGPWSRVTMLEASHFDANAAYASVDRHQLQDFQPYLYRTRDRGLTWQPITVGLPPDVYVHVVREDAVRRGLLFAGTERGVFVSFDDGDHWQPLQLNLPATSMRDLQVHGTDLIVATHGRGFWVVDDISPLRQADERVAAEDAHLFAPADTILFAEGGDNGTPLQKDEPQAPNPESGAYLDYYLRTAPSGPLVLEILDAAGAVLKTFRSDAAPTGTRGQGAGGIPSTSALWRPAAVPFSAAPGMHRAVWRPNTGSTGRGGGGGGGGGGRGAPREPVVTLPGRFTARLTVGGRSYSESFTVRPDPRGVAGEDPDQ